MVKKTILLFTGLLFLFIGSAHAQIWAEMMKDPSVNYYETRAAFDSAWAGIIPQKGSGYKVFERWSHYMEPRVYPKGNVTDASRGYEEFQLYLKENPQIAANLETRAANWTPMGPTGSPVGGGAGRVNCIRFDPTNSNIMYAGTPAGGLWKTTNGGTNWTTNTDQLAVLGITDIAIDPTNTQIMYIATGDGDAQDTYSIGVLKSTNGGTTWNTTNLSWTVNQGRTISRLLINPSNPQIVIAATSNGIYRTTDGGTTWPQVQTGNFKDAELRPSDPTTVYACGTTFWKSTNSGATFTQITNGVPGTPGRLAIAVTGANQSYVYMLACNNTNSGLTGVYRSVDNGTTFTLRDNSPNYLGYECDGSTTGGQGWYDLAIGVSPTNADEVFIGGINIWRSTNGGTSFAVAAHWVGGAGNCSTPYVHADIHDLVFLPGSGTTLWSGNDGGVWRTTNNGTSWTDMSNQMQIAQQYRLGLAPTSSTIILAGHQDNGCNRLTGGTWTEVYGGDGMDCYIDRTSNAVFLESYVYGDYRRSANSGGTWTGCDNGLPQGAGNASWLSPWHQDPTTATTFYAGGRPAMYRATTITAGGGNWAALGTPSGTGNIVEFDIAPSNNQIIYAVKSNAVSRSSNAGTAWTNITGTLPVGSAQLTNLEVSPTNPNKVWVTFSGYSSGNKVFLTTNGGTSWTNYSTGLPNLPANCIVFQTGNANQIVYVGTDVGVYVRDSLSSSWAPYLAGLPNVIVNDLEIYYGAPNKIRAATFGRGTWESDLYTSGSEAPIADFTSNTNLICPGQSVNYFDQSIYTPTSWIWTFPGGTPASSTVQNPTVTYSTAGTYAVTLQAINVNGSDTITVTNWITVAGPQALPLVEGFEGATFPALWGLTDGNNNGAYWFVANNTGGFGASAQSVVFNNYNYDEAGYRDDIRTPKYNFSSYASGTLTFDVAYARYDATYSDTLSVWATTNCGSSWTQVWIKGGTTLSTAPDNTTTVFIPTPAQWRTENVNVSAYAGLPDVGFAFRNHGRYGQVIWVDNVNLTGSGGAPPAASFTTSGNTICAGQTITYTNTSSGATSFNWSFPGGTPVSGSTSPINVTYNTAGTYTTTLTAINANGSSTSTQTITVNALPTNTASNTGPFCVGGTIQLNATAGATDYDWTGPNSYVMNNTQNPAIGSATVAMAGTYTCTITNAAGCTTTSTTIVTVNTLPTQTASNGGPYCPGATIQLNATAGATDYDWIGPASYTQNNVQNPTRPGATVAMGGFYTVTITNAAGCTTTSTTNVVVNPQPTANATNGGPYCAGATIQLNSVGGSATDDWAGPSYTQNNTQNPTIAGATLAMAGNYTVTVTNGFGCTSTSSTAVVVNANPTANATNGGPYCVGATIQLNSLGGSASDDWAGPSYTQPNTQNPTRPGATLAMAGNYTVTVTNAAGCTSTSSTNVVVNANPTANATNTGPYCAGATIQLNSVGGSGTDDWAGPSYTQSNTQNPTITGSTVAMSGFYTVTVTNAAGCTSASSTNVVVNANPTANATNGGPYCAGATIQLNSVGGSGTDDWAGPSYTQPNTQNPTRPGATLAMAGNYTVTVTNAAGCTSASSTNVVVNANPTANATNGGPYCAGATIQLNSVGGTATDDWSGPLTYSAPNTQNPTITGSTVGMSGLYTVTVTNAAGCTSASSTNVVVNANPIANATNTGPYCVGSTIQLNSVGGSATDDWAGPSYTQNNLQNPSIPGATLAMTGNYTVTLTNAAGCTSTSSTLVTVNTTPVATATNTGPYCVGGTIQLNSTGGGTYSWAGPSSYSNGTQNPSIGGASLVMGGTYTVTVTLGGSCTASSTTAVVVNANPTANPTNTGPYCAGASIQLNSIGGSASDDWAGPSYTQNNMQNPTIPGSTVAMSGLYTLTVTDVNGCIGVASTNVVVNANPTANATNTGPYCVGGTIQLNSVGGSATDDWAGPSYTQNDMQNPSISGATLAMSGNYTVTVTNAAGCTSASSTLVTVNTTPTATASNTGPYCVGGTIQLNSTGGGTYSWAGPLTYSNGTQNPTLGPATAGMGGTYTVTVTLGGGCTASSTTAVVVNPTPTANATNTGPYCAGATILLSSVGGSASDDWSGPSYTQNNVQNPSIVGSTTAMTGNYTVTVTNGFGCTSTSSTAVTVNPSPTANATNTGPYCAGATIQLNSVGGSGTDDWSGPSYTQNNMQNPSIAGSTPAMTGNYTVTLTNGFGCTSTSSTAVTVNANPIANATNTGPYCEGATIQLNSVGGSGTDDWSGPSYTQNNMQNPSIPGSTVGMTGNYTVTVTNGAGCTSTSSTTVTVNANPVATASNTGPYCSGATIQLNSTGVGTPSWSGPLSYSNGTANPTIGPSTPGMTGIYTVTVTNVAGCTSASTTSVTVNTTPTANASNTGPYCEGAAVQLNATGGGTYSWSGPSGFSDTNQNPSLGGAVLSMAGVYTVTVTLPGGCTASATTTIAVNTVPSVGANVSLNTVCQGQSVVFSGSGANSYSWNNGVTDGVPFIPAITNTYTVTGTALNGCTATATTTVTVNTLPNATANSNSPLCDGQTLNLTSGGGTDYDWMGPNSYVQNNTQNPSIPGVTTINAGTYTVTVTDGNGCSNTASTLVVINSNLTITAGSNSPVCDGSDLLLSVTNVGGATYDWSGPNSYISNTQNPTITGASFVNAGTYTVTATNLGCSGTSTVTVVINALPTPVANSNSPVCEGSSLDLTGTGGIDFDWIGPNSFVLNDTQNPVINPATPADAGVYTVTVTDANGCSATATVNAVVNPAPVTPTISANGDTLMANPSSGFNYQWYMNGSIISGEINPTYIASITADYSVVITDGNGCTSTSSDFNYVNTTGIDGSEAYGFINVYPNPNDGVFNVVVSNEHAAYYHLRVYNSIGQLVVQKNDIATSEIDAYEVDLSTFAVGTYTLVIYINRDAHSVKVVKK